MTPTFSIAVSIKRALYLFNLCVFSRELTKLEKYHEEMETKLGLARIATNEFIVGTRSLISICRRVSLFQLVTDFLPVSRGLKKSPGKNRQRQLCSGFVSDGKIQRDLVFYIYSKWRRITWSRYFYRKNAIFRLHCQFDNWSCIDWGHICSKIVFKNFYSRKIVSFLNLIQIIIKIFTITFFISILKIQNQTFV